MNPSDDTALRDLQQRTLVLLLVGVSAALVWILLPFYGPILWGAIIALLFAPVYRALMVRLKRRRNTAAVLTMLVVLVVVVLPSALVVGALAREAAHAYQQLQSGAWNPGQYVRGLFAALPAWVTSLLDRFGLVEFDILQQRLTSALLQGSQFIAKEALSIGQNTFELLVDLFIALYLAFFLIRDRELVSRALMRAIPLAPAHKVELLGKFTTVVRATVKGNLLVAAIQGALGGLAFWFLGVSGALLWAVLMMFLSLLPAVGAGLVWLPVAAYFFISGALWQGFALVAWGVLVIGLVDNLLRPVLVGNDARMPDYVVMITTLGGMATMGVNGFVIGPTVAAMFIAAWQLHGAVRDDG